MATLEKRVQVLFDPEQYKAVEAIARDRGTSVGAFIREAVQSRVDSDRNQRRAILEELFAQADADAAENHYPPFSWQEARVAYEHEMDPMARLERSVEQHDARAA